MLIMNEQIILKNRVKELRARLDLRQSDLAREIGVTRQTILAIEKGRLNPSINIALKAARVLREPVDYIFYLENQELDTQQSSNPAHENELVQDSDEPAAIWDFAK
jgi:putative transcriptional regulator